MPTDEQLNWLSEQAYWTDQGRDDVDYSPETGHIYFYNYDNKSLGQFKVLKVEDNPDNGMQAMAVAPVDKNGQVDYSEIVIAYAGTNSGDALYYTVR